jgi:hypothetical protein
MVAERRDGDDVHRQSVPSKTSSYYQRTTQYRKNGLR